MKLRCQCLFSLVSILMLLLVCSDLTHTSSIQAIPVLVLGPHDACYISGKFWVLSLEFGPHSQHIE